MSYHKIFYCDGCKKEFLECEMLHLKIDDGIIEHGGNSILVLNERNFDKHFCSWKCLLDYLKNNSHI